MKTMQVEGRQTCNNGKTYKTTGTGVVIDTTLPTSGDGYWSNVQRSVKVTALEVPYINDEQSFGELRVYFDTATWNTQEHGLIYTDELFVKELRKFLTTLNLNGADVGYSEQGLQGDNYVSLDVGAKFIGSWMAEVGEEA